MRLHWQTMQDGGLAGQGYLLPAFDLEAMRRQTMLAPRWLHFGASNILRSCLCVLLQKLLDAGDINSGLIVAEAFDEEILDCAFAPLDNACLAVTLKSDGTTQRRVVASIAQSIAYSRQKERLREVLCAPLLQVVSLTITEKGYAAARHCLAWTSMRAGWGPRWKRCLRKSAAARDACAKRWQTSRACIMPQELPE